MHVACPFESKHGHLVRPAFRVSGGDDGRQSAADRTAHKDSAIAFGMVFGTIQRGNVEYFEIAGRLAVGSTNSWYTIDSVPPHFPNP